MAKAATKTATKTPAETETKAQAKGGKPVMVEQTGSPIRREASQRATLKGLGLNKIGRVAHLPDTPETHGMIRKVHHLVKVLDAK